MSDKSPDAFRTISEVADWLGVQPHVLRFWESKFSQVRPVKRAGGRRYYRPNDMLLLGGIRKLLHEDGLTIKGAQKVLREEGISHVARLSQPLDAESAALSDMAAAAEYESDTQPAETLPDALKIDPDPSRPEVIPVQPEPHHVPDAPPEHDPEPPARPEPRTQTPPPDAVDAEPAPGPEPEEVPEAESAPNPSFVHKPRRAAEPEPRDADTADRLPSFLRPPKPADQQPAPHEEVEPPDPEAETELPLGLPDKGQPKPAAEELPKPRIVDAPDPDESALEVANGALSAVFSGHSLSADRRAKLMPLVARMAALRDRMAAARGR